MSKIASLEVITSVILQTQFSRDSGEVLKHKGNSGDDGDSHSRASRDSGVRATPFIFSRINFPFLAHCLPDLQFDGKQLNTNFYTLQAYGSPILDLQ